MEYCRHESIVHTTKNAQIGTTLLYWILTLQQLRGEVVLHAFGDGWLWRQSKVDTTFERSKFIFHKICKVFCIYQTVLVMVLTHRFSFIKRSNVSVGALAVPIDSLINSLKTEKQRLYVFLFCLLCPNPKDAVLICDDSQVFSEVFVVYVFGNC